MTTIYDLALILLRVVTGFLVWEHGAQKLFGLLGGVQAEAFTPASAVGAAEFFGGITLAAGFMTRPVALVLAADMAVRYVTQYLPGGFPPILIRQAEVTCLLFCTTLLLAFTGAGTTSIDAAIANSGWRAPLRRLHEHTPAVLGAVRVIMGLLFLSYGLRKMFGLLEGEPEPFLSLQWYAGVIELFGGAAIILGLATRPVAFLCSGEMAFAYFINHNPRGFFPIQNGGERAALFCFFYLFLFAAGAGKWSVDGLLRGRGHRSRLTSADKTAPAAGVSTLTALGSSISSLLAEVAPVKSAVGGNYLLRYPCAGCVRKVRALC